MLQVTKRDGRTEAVDRKKILRAVERACKGLEDVSPKLIADDALAQLFDGIRTEDVERATVLSAVQRIPLEPNYSLVAARLLLQGVYRDAFGKSPDQRRLLSDYKKAFKENLHLLVEIGRFDPRMVQVFDLGRLADALEPERDLLLKYLAVKTLQDRYINHVDGRRLETPQAFWMRVAMGVSLLEPDPTASAIRLYELYSTLCASPATPTLLNSGKRKPQLSSCFVSTLEDSIDGIYGTLHSMARLSKFGGGLGLDGTPLRGINSFIKGTNGHSQGIAPWARQHNDMILAVNQGGSRKGAECFYLETWHIDVEDFLKFRSTTGDDRLRCRDLNTAHWVPDEFMRRVEADLEWTLFSPDEVPGLHEAFGEKFVELYREYERKAREGVIKNTRTVKAKDLWRKMLVALKETGHPWITFKDAGNIPYQNQHAGVINSTQLCCVTGDQRAATDRGLMRVADLAEDGGVNVVAGRGAVRRASEMRKTILDAPVVEVVTEEGYTHKVTKDHPLWVLNRGWVEAAHLQPGDKVELQHTFGLDGDMDEPEMALICGLLAGDGTYAPSSAGMMPCIDLWPKDAHMAPEVERAVTHVLAKYREMYDLRTIATDTPKFAGPSEDGKMRLSSSPLGQVLTEFGVTVESKVRVPEFVWRGTRATVGQYLRGIFVTDGTIQAVPGKMTTVSLSSVDREYLAEIQVLLMNYGIKSRIRLLQLAGYRDMPNGRGGQSKYWCQESYRLLITSTRSCRNLEELAGFAKERGHTKMLENLKREGYPERFFAVVKEVVDKGREDVYCLMVDAEDRAWTCNGFITKNTEVFIHTIATRWNEGEVVEYGETAVCNLLSINVGAYAGWNGEIDFDNLAPDITEYVRALDNVISLNYYPTRETANANQKYRPIGLGVMGWHDLLLKKKLPFDSDEAIGLAGELQEFIAYNATLASIDLAAQRGVYPGYEGSNWSRGIFPHEAHAKFLHRHRGVTDVPAPLQDWEYARRLMAQHGIRNSLLQAVAPTATISSFLGCSEGIGPITAPLYVYETISGAFLVLNEHFVQHMKRLGKWSPAFAADLARNDGDVSGMDLPEDVKRLYRINYDLDQRRMMDATAARQLWIDQGQSHNVYYRGRSLKEMSEFYFHAWRSGLKSTYYLHTEAASKVQKHAAVTVEAAHDGAHEEAHDGAHDGAHDAHDVHDVLVEAVDQLPERTCPIDGTCESCT